MNKTITHLSLRAATLLTLMLLTILAAPNEARAAEIVANGTCGDNLTWTLTGSGVLTFSGTGEIPSYISLSGYITNIIVEDGVTSIGEGAFQCYNDLVSVTIGNDVTSIGYGAFYNCPNLVSVTIGSGVTSIGEGAFYLCDKLTSIYVMATTPPVLKSSILYNPGAVRIYVPADSKNDYKDVWSVHEGLISTTIASGKFENPNDPSIDGVNWFFCEDGRLLFNGYGEISCDRNWTYSFIETYSRDITSIDISGGVTSIKEGAFFGCSSLTSVTICSSVESIGSYAFYACYNGEDNLIVTIPASVTSVGERALDMVPKVTVVLSGANDNTSLLAALSDAQTVDLTFMRTFPAGKKQTVCLPFDPSELLNHGKVWEFTGINDSKAVMTEITSPATLSANTPYIFEATNDMTSITFNSATISIGADPKTAPDGQDFVFHGTYIKLHWDANDDDVKNGHIYGFLMEDSEDDPTRKEGMFVKAKYNTNVRPFSCYLEYNGELTGTETTARRKASAEELPDVIEIEWKSAEEAPGEATGIDELRIKNQELRDEGWFSLDGRRLSGRPTAKGLYIHNGKLVIKN